MVDCTARVESSPENPACAWCDRYRINLDRDGRLCARCARDGAFRRMLAQQAAMRFAPDCAGSAWCKVFDTITDEDQCARCQKDPAVRAFLYGQAQARRQTGSRSSSASCPHRGDVLRVELRGCCGNRRTPLEIRACALRGETHAGLCATCDRNGEAAGS